MEELNGGDGWKLSYSTLLLENNTLNTVQEDLMFHHWL